MKKIKNSLKIMIVGFLLLFLWNQKNTLGNFLAFSETNYASEYVYVLNRENKKEIISKNEKTRAYPASLTKIMTTLVALEEIEDLSALAPIDKETYQQMARENASMAGFYGNEATSYRDLLYGTILSSGGETANSLAINISGSREDFVELMNQKAVELGLKNTYFMNPEGFDDIKQYSTAADMAHLLDYALEDGDFRAIFTKDKFQSSSTVNHPEGILLESTVLSKLSPSDQDGFEIIGGKSGTTWKSGQSWITLGIKEGVEYIVVTMGAPMDEKSGLMDQHISDTLAIYNHL